MIERPYLKDEYDHMPEEKYAGLGYATHRYADFIPVADDKDQYALRESVADIGLVEPIVLFEDAILDGRHRYKACQVMGVEPRFIQFEGDDEAALKFVLAKNIARRQLTTIQKLTLREKLIPEIDRLRTQAKANLAQGLIPGSKAVDTTQEVADMLGLGRATVQRADAVQRIAAQQPEAQEFLDEMLAGNIGVKTAYEKAKAIDVSADLDREARAQAGPTPAKQLGEIRALVTKAHGLVAYDYDHVVADEQMADMLDELSVWVEEALLRARPF